MEDGGAMGMNFWRVRRKVAEEDRKRLESAYGVRIHEDSLTFSCRIVHDVQGYYDDEGQSVEYREALLQRKAADLLETACSLLRSQIDAGEVDEDEKRFDAGAYELLRCQVEAHEMRKEKDPARMFWLLRVEKELKGYTCMLDQFLHHWKDVLLLQQQGHISKENIQLLQSARQDIQSCLINGWEHNSNLLSTTVGRLEALVNLLTQRVCPELGQVVMVGPRLIAKVASSLTGFPASWLLRGYKPYPKDLDGRLYRRQVGKKVAMLTIFHALSRAALKPGPLEGGIATRPIGSFLFLCGDRHGGPEFAEALADELFDGLDSLIHFDMLEYADPCSASRLLGVPVSQCEPGALGQLTEAVKSKRFSVVLFSNIDVAHPSVIDILIEIASRGRVTDGQGSTVDFTKTLLIMTSKLGTDKQLTVTCKCFPMDGEYSVKELLDCHPSESRQGCDVLRRLEMVQKQLKPELFGQLDDIVLFACLSFDKCKAAARLRLRDIASSMTRRGLIIYPSEAALNHILSMGFWWRGGETTVKVWMEENLVPELRGMCAKGEIDDNHIIYIDTLVGAAKLSYRLVKCEDFVGDQGLRQLQDSLAKLSFLRRIEKYRIKTIFLLQKKLFELKSSVGVCARTDFECRVRVIREVVSIIDVMIKETDANLVADEVKVLHGPVNEEAELKRGEEAELTGGEEANNKKAKKGVEYLKARLHSNLGDQAIEVIAAAALRIIDVRLHPASNDPVVSFLFFGLTSFGKAELVKDLAEKFVTDDGANLLMQIKLSEYSDSGSLSRLMDALQSFAGIEDCGMQLPEAVRMRPCSIVFLDQVEKAHASVFCALLSMLDNNMFRDDHGRNLDFGNTIVIITSDLGNKQIFARLFYYAFENSKQQSAIKQEETRGVFRWELLTRVDELVFLNPFAARDDHLKKVFRISMRSCPHLEGRAVSGFFGSLACLFQPVNDPDSEDSQLELEPVSIKLAARELSRARIGRDICSSSSTVASIEQCRAMRLKLVEKFPNLNFGHSTSR